MSKSLLFIIILLVIIVTIIISQYYHKRHREYQMAAIEEAVRGAFARGVETVGKEQLVASVKKRLHCSSKEAHYILGVAKRKHIVDVQGNNVTLM